VNILTVLRTTRIVDGFAAILVAYNHIHLIAVTRSTVIGLVFIGISCIRRTVQSYKLNNKYYAPTKRQVQIRIVYYVDNFHSFNRRNS